MNVTVFEMAPGRWRLREEYRDAEGKRRFRYTRVKGTKRDADLARARIMAGLPAADEVPPVRNGRARSSGEMLISTWATAWMAEITASGTHGANTLDTYRCMLAHVSRTWGQRRLVDLTRADVVAGIGVLRKQRAPRTVRHIYERLHALVVEAHRRGMVPKVVTSGVKLPPAPRNGGVPLIGDEQALLLEKARDHRLGPLIRFALSTGLRRGELCGLRWDDFDPVLGTVRVQRAVAQRGSGRGTWLKPPKTAAGARTVTLPPSVAAETRQRMEEARKALDGRSIAGEAMFLNAVGGRWRPSAMSAAVNGWLATIGLRGVSLHDLRHDHATTLLRLGGNPRAVAARLGHAKPSLTLDMYAHALPADDARLAETLERDVLK